LFVCLGEGGGEGGVGVGVGSFTIYYKNPYSF